MNKKVIKRIILIAFFVLTVWILSDSVDAAYISVSPSKSSGNPEESVTLNISSDCVGRINISVTNGTVSSNKVWIEGAAQSITVKLGTTGTTTVTATAEGGKMSNNGVDVPVSSVNTNISILNNSSSGNNNNSGTNNNNSSKPTTPSTTEKSNVATLANLGIKPNDFSGFKANTLNYSTEVPNEVESIEVYAKKGQNGQTISGLGTKKLNEGQNKIEVIVTAEDGKTKKTYTINVTRKTKDETQPEEQPEEQNEDQPMEETFGLSELKIDGYELDPQFQTDIYEYKMDLKENLEKLDITTLATEANSTVEVTGNENLVEGENIITITVKGENEEKIATYQIIINKILSTTENNNNLETDHKQMISQIIIISVILIIALLILILLIVKIRKTKSSDGYIQYENILENNKDENNTKKNDEDETIKEETKRKKHSKGKRFK